MKEMGVDSREMSLFGDVPSLLREARARARLSQERLAEMAGVSQRSLSSYENGKNVPSVSSFERLLVACGVGSLAELHRLIASLSGEPGEVREAGPPEPPWERVFDATDQEELMQRIAVRMLRLEEWFKRDLERRQRLGEPDSPDDF